MALRHPNSGRKTSAELNGPLTHRELAVLFGISHSRVQQIEEQAMKKIHKALAGQARAEGMGIREFLFGDGT